MIKLSWVNAGWQNRKEYKRLASRSRRRKSLTTVRDGDTDDRGAHERQGYTGWIW